MKITKIKQIKRTAIAFWALAFMPFGAAFAAPRLIAVIVVDQMQADYLELSSPTYTGGLARLRSEGFVFTDARHEHVPTETGPGHAVIMTGRYSDTTGIVGNAWYDRRRGASVYCADDSVNGAGPEQLWGYTLGDALKARDSRSLMVAVSLKDRSAIFMGGKRADAALWYSAKRGEFRGSPYYGEEPAWLAGFNSGLRAKGGALRDASTAAMAEIAFTPEADRMVLELALEAAKRYRLGRDDHPDILAVSFSATDYIGHRYGPQSPQMSEQLRRLDLTIGALLDGLERQVGRGRFDVVLTSDHGVHPHPEAARRILWDDLTAAMERALQYDYPSRDKWVLANEYPNVYLNRDQARGLGVEWRLFLRQAAHRLETVEGLEKAYIPDELDPADPYYAVYARSVAPGRSGDLLVRAARDTLIADPRGKDDHGTPYEYDSHVPLVFWGPDFQTGRSSEAVRVADLAATAAVPLGLAFKPRPDSRVLPALKEPAAP